MNKYKFSKYNHFKIYGNTTIGVNLHKKILFAIEKRKYTKLISYVSNTDQLALDDSTLFSLMIKLGIIQEIDFDDSIRNQLLLENRVLNYGSKTYRLTINPTLNCNFNCWYCYEAHTKKVISKEAMHTIINYVKNLVNRENIKLLYLDWFGGEPLLCYNSAMKFIAYESKKICDERNVDLESAITTNGYLLRPEMMSFFKDVNMQSFQITLDGEKDVHDKIRYQSFKDGSYDKIVQNIILLAQELNPKNLSLRINFTKESLAGISKIIDSFPLSVRSKITVLFQQIWQDKDNVNISVNEIEKIKTAFFKAGFKVERDILNTKGYTCYADMFKQTVINYDGRVFKCTARNFEKEKEDGYLTKDGEIHWNSILLSTKMSKSTFENDHCWNCKYLPICFGPCHQKFTIINEDNAFDKYCYKGGIESTLDYIFLEFKKTKKPIAPLITYDY